MRNSVPAAVSPSGSTFDRGLEVLAVVADAGPMRVEELAQKTGLPVSTVYRYVKSLVSFEFLDRKNGLCVPGARLRRLGANGPINALRDVAKPLLQSLSEGMGETALLTTRSGLSALVVDTVVSPQPMRLSYTPGTLHPLHAGASGKLLLAFAPDEVYNEIVSRGLERFTPHTPTRAQLAKSMEDIRRNRWTVTRSERDLHAIGIGVVIEFGESQTCALSIAGPEHRLKSRVAEVVQTLQHHARDLQGALSGEWTSRPVPQDVGKAKI